MKPDSYMPLFGNDFFEATRGFDDRTLASYLRALWHYWCHTHCTGLPDDDDYLRRVCQCPVEHWARTKGLVFDGAAFFALDAGRWHQKRARELYSDVAETYQRRLEYAERARQAKRNAETKVDTNAGTKVDTNVGNKLEKALQPKPKPEPNISTEREIYIGAGSAVENDKSKSPQDVPTPPASIDDTPKPPKASHIPSWSEVWAQAQMIGWGPESIVKQWYDDRVAEGWTDSQGLTIGNWRRWLTVARDRHRQDTAKGVVKPAPTRPEDSLIVADIRRVAAKAARGK